MQIDAKQTPAPTTWRDRIRQRGAVVEVTTASVLVLIGLFLALRAGSLPGIVLTIILCVLTINFAVPLSVGRVGLTPLAGIVSLLSLSLQPALAAFLIGLPLAELLRGLWQPLWRETPAATLRNRYRWGQSALHALNVVLVGLMLLPDESGLSVLQRWLSRVPNTNEELFLPIMLTLAYLFLYVSLMTVYWQVAGQPQPGFLAEAGPHVIGIVAFAIPLTLFLGSISLGIPTFVMLCIGIGAFAINNWTSWQRRFVMAQRLDQFARMNEIGVALRETLSYDTVLTQIQAQVATLLPTDVFYIALQDDRGAWSRPINVVNESGVDSAESPFTPDDFTRWVIDNRRMLEVDRDTVRYAARHDLIPPQPTPAVWIGIPLISAERVIGAMVLQQVHDGEPLSRWRREMLLSIASQASAALENARLHSETVRLFNLTDEALARRVEQLQALLDSINEGVLMLDRLGQVVLLNPPAAALIGRTVDLPSSVPLDPAAAAPALGYRPAQLAALLETLREHRAPTPERAVYELAQHDGQPRRFIERVEVPIVSDETQQLKGWLMVLRDVTEERERVEWRADLTRMIVHDLRNPITTLISTVDLLQKRLPDPRQPELFDLLFGARRGANSMLEMVDSLMDINRAEAGKFAVDAEAMRLPHLVDRVVAYIQPLADQRNVALTFTYPPDLPFVWADAVLLRRVLVNLLDNALKFTPTGGTVKGAIALEPPSADSAEPGLRVTITDNGPGIPADEKPYIFERFITFNRGGGQVRGTGLGLTFCKLAVEAHGGRIWVEDAPGGGSTFVFTLPGGVPF